MIAVPGTVYSCSAPLLDGRLVSLDEFRGRVLLIVNTASQCGFTPQYKGLEETLSSLRRPRFFRAWLPLQPVRQPGAGLRRPDRHLLRAALRHHLPGLRQDRGEWAGTHPLYQFLKKSRPGIFGTRRIKWNFTKFLIDRQGSAVSRFSPKKGPLTLVAQIERLLAAPPALR